MTPLFQDWLLERIEEGYLTGMATSTGAPVAFRHASINGWYYTATPRFPPLAFLPATIGGRGRPLVVMWYGLVRTGSRPALADRKILRGELQRWRDELLPRYHAVVAHGESNVETASPAELASVVDEVGRLGGEYLWSLALVGGAAWKMEACLGRFLRQQLPDIVGGGVLVLLRGLPGVDPEVPGHAVQTADWHRPTAGELDWSTPGAPGTSERRRSLIANREAAEAACRRALADRPKLLARFEELLQVAQRYVVAREQQARDLTLGWPLLRRCALRLGAGLHARGAIDEDEDVFFLKAAELEQAGSFQEVVRHRRAEWERHSRLVAPLSIGRPPRLLEGVLNRAVEAVRAPGPQADAALVGEPASPGRATGPVRVVRGAAEFDRFRQGEVLVATATAPAWTPLFGRAAAVVTDGGTLAAHASLVAREYGIPAVVGTGVATARLRDGQVVTVDGGAGLVMLVSETILTDGPDAVPG
jgi:rifampicin phosphotransferase